MTLKYLADTFGTATISLADDTATSIAMSGNTGVVIGFTGSSNTQFMVYSRSSGSPITTTMVLGTSVTNAGTTVLTGTTSVDGTLNISSNGGLFYVENRLGSTQTVELTVLGG